MGIPLDEFRAQIAEDQDEGCSIHICQGPPRCTKTDGTICEWCYVIDSDDPRSTEQILADMRRPN